MRVIMFAQVAAAAFLLSGCPGSPASDPTGGGTCPTGETCSSTGGNTGGQGGNSGTGGKGGSGNSGVGGSGNASSSGGAGGAGNGSGGAGGTGTGSSTGGNGQGGSGGGTAIVCDPLLMDITVKEDSAKVCSTEKPVGMQCKFVIQGLCCPIAVDNANSPEVLAYLDALKKYMQNGCMPSCPPDPCPPTDKAQCLPGAGTNGTCGTP